MTVQSPPTTIGIWPAFTMSSTRVATDRATSTTSGRLLRSTVLCVRARSDHRQIAVVDHIQSSGLQPLDELSIA